MHVRWKRSDRRSLERFAGGENQSRYKKGRAGKGARGRPQRDAQLCGATVSGRAAALGPVISILRLDAGGRSHAAAGLSLARVDVRNQEMRSRRFCAPRADHSRYQAPWLAGWIARNCRRKTSQRVHPATCAVISSKARRGSRQLFEAVRWVSGPRPDSSA